MEPNASQYLLASCSPNFNLALGRPEVDTSAVSGSSSPWAGLLYGIRLGNRNPYSSSPVRPLWYRAPFPSLAFFFFIDSSFG